MKKVIRAMAKSCMLFAKSIVYRLCKLIFKADEKTVFFESFQGKKYACNPRAIYEYMVNCDKYRDYTFVWAFRDISSHEELEEIKGKCIVVKYEGFKYFKYLCKAKYWIINSNTRAFLKPDKNQLFVQTWHGTPLKKIGIDVKLEGNAVTNTKEQIAIYNREAKKISYMTAPSKWAAEKFISAFNLGQYHKEDRVLVYGYPRNDKLINHTAEDVKRVKTRLGIDESKTVIMYAPTFRDNKHDLSKGYRLEHKFDFDAFEEKFGKDCVLLFRSHYFISEKLKPTHKREYFYDVSDEEDITDLFLITDILITDYSSVFFDYACLKRPICFYMYDLSEYKNQVRDFYFDIEKLPGPICTTFDQVTGEISRMIPLKGKDMTEDEKYRNFYDKFCSEEKGSASREILETIID